MGTPPPAIFVGVLFDQELLAHPEHGTTTAAGHALVISLGIAAVVIATLAGGWLAMRADPWQVGVFAVAAGFLLASALSHVVADMRAAGLITAPALALVVGATYGLLSQLHRVGHRYQRVVGPVGAAAFLGHRFVEGLVVGVGLTLDGQLAAAAVIAVAAHSAGEGAAVVSYLRVLSADRRSAGRWLLATALAPVAGAIVGAVVTLPAAQARAAVAVMAGLFLFVAHVTVSAALRYSSPARVAGLACVGAVAFAATSVLA